ncbi:hypothetical protein PR002_g33033, partial [Phytophthora rubi]
DAAGPPTEPQNRVVERQNNREAYGPARDGIELLSDTVERITSTSSADNELQSVLAEDESILTGDDYKKVATLSLVELQGCFREKIKKRWTYVHTNAMGIAFMLDPATDLDDFVGTDSEKVDDQACPMAVRCGIITAVDIPKLTAEILEFKSEKRRGGEAEWVKFSESSPQFYWGSKSEKKSFRYPL